MSKPNKINLRVEKGVLVPVGRADIESLRSRNYKLGDIVQGVITKPRNARFNGLVHKIGWLCMRHIPEFADYDNAHQVLKRLQLEANLGCTEIMAQEGDKMVKYRIPESLSFENLDQFEFQEISKGFCRHIAAEYWHDLDGEAIEQMAECFVEE